MVSDILGNDEIEALLNASKAGESISDSGDDVAGLTEAETDAMVQACKDNHAGIAESINLCFEKKYRVEIGEPIPWASAGGKEEFSTAGLQVIIAVGGTGIIVLIPESMPLPDWYTKPGESEAARLQTLAMEWSMNLLPESIEAGEFVSTATNDLYEDTIGMQPTDWATVIPLQLFEEEAEEPTTILWLITAVTLLPFEPPVEEPVATPVTTAKEPAHFAASAPVAAPQLSGAMARILNLPVTVNVQLAQKKIEMEQLMMISPGALITFNKSCEDLLELYVNNSVYCRGEAVKIGEKFGLKVNEIGGQIAQTSKVL